MFSTLAIRTNMGSGSGFIFNAIRGEAIAPLLITNKHVVRSCDAISLRFHLGTNNVPNGKTHTVSMSPFFWIDHPNPEIDLCAIPLLPYLESIQKQGLQHFYIGLRGDNLPTADQVAQLSAIESVTMVGYPTGLADHVNNLPIMRRGVTANHPAIDFDGKPEGVVDMACFPGSSGSPIFVLNEGMYQDRDGGTVIGTRGFLLGVLYGGPIMQADGHIQVRSIPTAQVPVAVTQMMIHLGYYVKAREVQVLAQHILDQANLPPSQP